MAQEQDYLAKKQYVDENFQPRLVAGTGISINPITNEITSSGGGSLVTYAGNPNLSQGDSLGVLTINGVSNTIMSPGLIPGTNVTITTDIATGAKTIAATGGTTVTPNPQGTPSGILTSIGIGNAIYSLQGGAYYGTTDPDLSLGIDGDIYIKYTSGTPDTINAMFVKINDEWIEAELGGGSGTDVEANPTGAATDTLNKIRIGQTIYDIEGSSEGGYIEKELVYTVEQGARWETFTNPDSDNPLLIENVYKGAIKTFIFNPNDLPARDGGVDNYVTIGQTLTGININLGQTNSGETVYISLQTSFDSSVESIKVYEILSYNNIDGAVELYSSNTTDNTITLSHSFRDFEYINLVGLHNDGYSVNAIYKTSTMSNGTRIALCDDAVYMWYTVTDDTTLTLYRNSSGYHVAKIYGFNVGGSGGNANIEEMTQAEYDALPSTKESDDIVRFVYFDGGTPQLDPNYTYVTYGQNDEIVVRIYHEDEADEEVLWFFNGWNQTSGDMAIPSELTVYAPTSTDPISSKSYLTSDMETQVGYIGFYQNHIRSWDVSQANLYTGIVYGVVDPTSGNKQNNKYYDPYVYLPLDATRHIYLNGRQYSGAGGGSSTQGMVKLAEYNGAGTGYAAGETITLSDDINNYDALLFDVQYSTAGTGFQGSITPVERFKTYTTNFYAEYDPAAYTDVKYVTDTSIYVLRASNAAVHTIYGVKFGGGGGTTVIANPEDEPTDALETIQIDDTVYNIPGGLEPIEMQWSEYRLLPLADRLDPTKQYFVKNIPGGGDGTIIDDLFENDGTTNPTTITFDNPITDYDIISFQVETTNHDAIFTMDYIVDNLTIGDYIGAGSYSGIFVWYTYTDVDELTFLSQSAAGHYLSRIRGTKFGSGGGGGDVEPNPSGTPTDTLNTIGIDGTIYNIAGSGGGERFESEIIYQNPGTTIPSTITLTKSINDFDMILLSGYRNDMTAYWSSSSYLSNELTTGKIIVLADDVYYAWYTITNDTTLTSTASSIVIDKIYGLKFGSGAGGGGGFSKTNLYTNSGTGFENTITLSDDFDNYDYLEFVTYKSDDNTWDDALNEKFISKEILTELLGNSMTSKSDAFMLIGDPHNGAQYARYSVASKTSFSKVWTNGAWTLKEINGIKFASGGGGSGSSGINYSTEEQVVGTWIDGKPLYQKSIPFVRTLGNAWNNTGIDVGTDLSLDKLISIELHGLLGEGLSYESIVTPSFVDCGANKANLRFWLPTTYSLVTDYITIRYTKTTD